MENKKVELILVPSVPSKLQLISEYKEYKIKNNLIVTNKQLNYIKNLYNSLSDENKKLIENETLIIKNIEGFNNLIKSFNTIELEDETIDDGTIFGIIEILKKYAPASFIQILSI